MKPQIENLGKVSITVEKDPYDASKAYPKLTIVYIEGDYRTYISRKPVLPNTSILDKEFWIPFSSLSEQLLINYNGFKELVLQELATQNVTIRRIDDTLTQFINTDITNLIEEALAGLAVVIDDNYVHTDNNYTSTEKTKLGALPTNSGLNTLLENITNRFADYYTKLQTYNQTEIDNKVQAVRNALDTLIGTNDVTTAIDTFNEIKSFLADYSNNGGDLKDIIDALETAVKTWTTNNFVEQANLYNNIYNKTEVYTKSEIDGKVQTINNTFGSYLLSTDAASIYLSKTDAANQYQPKGSYLVAADIEGKANKSELTITPGTGNNSDKTTIQLKNNVSATVLTEHQDISGKANASETYTKTEVDNLISDIQVGQGSNLANYYTKTQIDSQQAVQDTEIAKKANSSDLHTVATSGSYADLNNKPTLFSGDYNDLANKPNIPAAQVQADWNETDSSKKSYIKNKPDLDNIPSGGGGGSSLPKNIIAEEDGLYQIKDNAVYPIAHPDISTQPSILPQRFGNLDVYEVLIANGREEEIPIDATVISAFSFNKKACIPATVRKDYEPVNRTLEGIDKFPIDIINLHRITLKANFDVKLSDLCKYLVFYTEAGDKFYVKYVGGGIFKICDEDDTYNEVNVSNRTVSFSYIGGGPTFVSFTYNDPEIIKLPLKHWTIYNDEDIIPDFTLVRYFGGKQEDYYNYAYNHNNNDTAKSPFYEDLNIQTSDYAVFNQSILTKDNYYGVAINNIPYKVVGYIYSNNNTYYVAINNNHEFVIYNIHLVKVGDFVLGTEGYEAQSSVINKGSVFELLNPKPDAVTKFIITSTEQEGESWLDVNVNSFGCEDVNAGANIGYANLVRKIGTQSYNVFRAELVVLSSSDAVNIKGLSGNEYDDAIYISLSKDTSSTRVYSTVYPALIEFKAKLGT